MKTIQLTQGEVAIVDDEDYELLRSFNWRLQRNKRYSFAIRNDRLPDGRRTTIRMHHMVVCVGDGYVLNHRDGNGLNNQKSNLRVATKSQAQYTKRLQRSSKSGLKGVFWDSTKRKWRAEISANGKKIRLGYFCDRKEAYSAYCKASGKYHGEFGRTG